MCIHRTVSADRVNVYFVLVRLFFVEICLWYWPYSRSQSQLYGNGNPLRHTIVLDYELCKHTRFIDHLTKTQSHYTLSMKWKSIFNSGRTNEMKWIDIKVKHTANDHMIQFFSFDHQTGNNSERTTVRLSALSFSFTGESPIRKLKWLYRNDSTQYGRVCECWVFGRIKQIKNKRTHWSKSAKATSPPYNSLSFGMRFGL